MGYGFGFIVVSSRLFFTLGNDDWIRIAKHRFALRTYIPSAWTTKITKGSEGKFECPDRSDRSNKKPNRALKSITAARGKIIMIAERVVREVRNLREQIAPLKAVFAGAAKERRLDEDESRKQEQDFSKEEGYYRSRFKELLETAELDPEVSTHFK